MKIISILFGLVGLSLLYGSANSVFETKDFLSEAIYVKGEVISLERRRSDDSYTYAPVVRFDSLDQEPFTFTSSVSSNPASYDTGEVVGVLYSEYNPNSARIDSFSSLWLKAIIFAIMGLVFSSIAFVPFLWRTLTNKKIKKLKENGEKVVAKLDRIDCNTSVTLNGRHPYNIIVKSGSEEFKSNKIWFNPENYIQNDEFEVFVDKENPKKYYVDTSFLPKK